MNILFVVGHPREWPIAIPGVEIVSARTYLFHSAYGDRPHTRVFNLCHSHRYQDRGYYVSLLAEARGHQPLPDVKAIEDAHAEKLALPGGIGDAIDADEDELDLNIYFGRDAQRRHEKFSAQLFNLLQIPLLRVVLARRGGQWEVRQARALRAAEIPDCDHAALVQAATECVTGHHQRATSEPAAQRPALAILHHPSGKEAPSNAGAMHRFCEAAETAGMRCSIIDRNDIGRIGEFDALFIRDTTRVDHYTYQFARQAALAGLVVIDDPDSIIRCSNKVYLTELLNRHRIPMPKTLTVHRENIGDIVAQLGLPCILKKPDGAFSCGVLKAHTADEVRQHANMLLEESDLILAQEYVPTEFDWRIGVLDRRILFACKYHMVAGHWQIIRHDDDAHISEGRAEAVPLAEVPENVLTLALDAANLIGDGFYGVDLKQHGHHCTVIEINDNPNIDAGNEDGVLQEALYQEVMEVFRRRIEARKGSIRS